MVNLDKINFCDNETPVVLLAFPAEGQVAITL